MPVCVYDSVKCRTLIVILRLSVTDCCTVIWSLTYEIEKAYILCVNVNHARPHHSSRVGTTLLRYQMHRFHIYGSTPATRKHLTIVTSTYKTYYSCTCYSQLDTQGENNWYFLMEAVCCPPYFNIHTITCAYCLSSAWVTLPVEEWNFIFYN